ncbi:MAG: 50S ribosomal protein L14e [Candidatus Odinarchaeota archaeon]|nr:50S ribosomal protein L14e [Candidatus Odinarchaeota archaeon]
MIFDIGRICVKTLGREAGRKCVIVDVIDEKFVLVTGPKNITGVRRRRANVKHLEPTPEVLEIQRGASDDDVIKALEAANKLDWMRERIKI